MIKAIEEYFDKGRTVDDLFNDGLVEGSNFLKK